MRAAVCAGGGVDALITVGDQLDPQAFGAAAGHRIKRYVPQSSVLARCAAAVCDGGSGTVMGSLEQGLPLVLPPMGADQPLNAAPARRSVSGSPWTRCA
ncbi:MAG TPA: nucleotide disphospho-sugar-binding domain-containing protein [Egibacteraceae bacterium]|nr:nucleotide disphospho-sugar-binding domain-containing protein [Egibacteraceae bacterium]